MNIYILAKSSYHIKCLLYVDTAPPRFENCVDIEETLHGRNKKKIYYRYLTVTDNVDKLKDLQVDYSIKSGSVFELGETSVTVEATDSSGNKATCRFKVKLTTSTYIFLLQ